MDKKNLFIIFSTIILIIFISGCTQLNKETSKEQAPKVTEPVISQVTEPVSSQADKEIISDLMSKLNSNIIDYSASYNIEREVHSWAGHSGSTDYTEKSNISIYVDNGQIITYTFKYIKEGWPIDKEDYYEYYNSANKELCKQYMINKTTVCNKEIPSNFDATVKTDITNYLKNIQIIAIAEKDNEKGHCYLFSNKEMNHEFCFNENNLITFAQWGINVSKSSSTSVDINKVERIR